MAKLEIPKKELYNGGKFLKDYLGQDLFNTESDLIVKDGMLYKIILCDAYKRERVMLDIDNHKKELPISLKDLLYDNNNFYGYSMTLLEGYITINKLLKSDIDLKLRKSICLEILKISEKLESWKLLYFDWHSNNLMYKDDLQLLDIDSAIYTKSTRNIALARRYLLELCISIIIGLDFDFDFDSRYFVIENRIVEKTINEEEIFLSFEIPLDYEYMKRKINENTPMMVDYIKEIVLTEQKKSLLLTKN